MSIGPYLKEAPNGVEKSGPVVMGDVSVRTLYVAHALEPQKSSIKPEVTNL